MNVGVIIVQAVILISYCVAALWQKLERKALIFQHKTNILSKRQAFVETGITLTWKRCLKQRRRQTTYSSASSESDESLKKFKRWFRGEFDNVQQVDR